MEHKEKVQELEKTWDALQRRRDSELELKRKLWLSMAARAIRKAKQLTGIDINVFGSVLKPRTFRAESDVDFVVINTDTESVRHIIEEEMAGIPVDIVSFLELRPSLKKIVLREMQDESALLVD